MKRVILVMLCLLLMFSFAGVGAAQENYTHPTGAFSLVGLGELADEVENGALFISDNAVLMIFFGDAPIGSYQALQFPLAEAYAALECARLLNFKAARLFDNRADSREIGAAANMAKAVAVENAIKAVDWSMRIFGGFGYAKEYDVERLLRDINLFKVSPISQQMALNYIGEHLLGMPRTYS